MYLFIILGILAVWGILKFKEDIQISNARKDWEIKKQQFPEFKDKR